MNATSPNQNPPGRAPSRLPELEGSTGGLPCLPIVLPDKQVLSRDGPEQLPQKDISLSSKKVIRTAGIWGKSEGLWSFTPERQAQQSSWTSDAVQRDTLVLTQLPTPPTPTPGSTVLPGARAGLSGDRRVTDLSLAGAHRRLLLSRPPPRRTVRTLLEKQNWGVRHGGGYPASPTPASR